MTEQTIDKVKQLTNIPSPTGNTYEIISVIKEMMEKEGYTPVINRKGSLMITVEGENT